MKTTEDLGKVTKNGFFNLILGEQNPALIIDCGYVASGANLVFQKIPKLLSSRVFTKNIRVPQF